MYLYVELWKPKASWTEVPREQREEFLNQLRVGTRKMEKLGVELVGFAVCDEATPHGEDYRYIAVWKMPNLGHVHMLEKAVQDEGWYHYFDVTNARGKMTSVEAAARDMVKI